MLGTRNWLLVTLALPGCGGAAFTSDAPDGGGTMKDGGLLQGDASLGDGSMDDAQARKDSGKGHDGDDGGGVTGVDAGPIGGLDAGPPCAAACPSGFSCLFAKCIDHAAAHFSTTMNGGGNWTYGSRANEGSSFVVYPHAWQALGTTINFWGKADETIELSVFHNGALASQTTGNATVPPSALAFDPGGTALSVVRWSAPTDGSYAIDVTFTGLAYTNGMSPMVGVGVIVGAVIQSSQTINAYGATNTASYSATSALLTRGTTVDFYVKFLTGMSGGGAGTAGGTMIDAKISTL